MIELIDYSKISYSRRRQKNENYMAEAEVENGNKQKWIKEKEKSP